MENIKNIERRDDRISCMEMLFSYDMNNEYIYLNPNDDYSDFATELVNYVCANLETIDEVIKNSLVNYKINRLSYVDRAIIRVAAAEMMMGTPKAVVINEALEIVKQYSDQGDGASVRFVNKVLEGEISNFKRHSRGHFYFTLKDQGAQISATMFAYEAKKVMFEPKDGMKVLVKGSVSVYEPQGTYSINITEMEEKGVGSLYLAYEKLKKELQDDGYFDEIHKKPIPKFPKAIGVLTSPTGAAVRDCINTITRRYPLAKIYVYPTLVQGEDAKGSIVKNIELANSQNLVDVLIVGRGGGSIEDLWAFNEKIVAMAIYNSKLPVISAVGHETDFTIADFVADKRAATPTAASELATPNLVNLKENVNICVRRLEQNIFNVMDNYKKQLLFLDQRLEKLSPVNKLDNMNQRRIELERIINLRINQIFNEKKHILSLDTERLLANNPISRLEKAYHKSVEYMNIIDLKVNKILENKVQQISLYTEKLKVLNPLSIMEKGFSVVMKDGKIIKSKNDLQKDDIVEVKLVDGVKNAKIMED